MYGWIGEWVNNKVLNCPCCGLLSDFQANLAKLGLAHFMTQIPSEVMLFAKYGSNSSAQPGLYLLSRFFSLTILQPGHIRSSPQSGSSYCDRRICRILFASQQGRIKCLPGPTEVDRLFGSSQVGHVHMGPHCWRVSSKSCQSSVQGSDRAWGRNSIRKVFVS